MTTMNREEQKQVLIDTANHIINRDNTSPYSENLRELARIALASLEAEPVGAFHIAEQQVDGTSDYLKDGEWPIDNGIIEVYAAPLVPVVPAALPENDDEDGHDIDYLEQSEVYALGRTAGWNACRAAMLYGAVPASQTYKLNKLSGNSPATPDSWISCSERMPNEEDVLVYCSDTKEQMVGFHKGKGLFQFFYMNGVEGVCEPSHWMPLPEPPRLKEL
ncbi:DUF551 domain-containing protein [Escherichia coli]|nr:DUF551 domain-containing protein [Escherichia coli]